MKLQITYITLFFLLFATLAEAQIWKSGVEVLTALPSNFVYNTVCFETPPNQGGEQEITQIDMNCEGTLTPQNSHPPYCVSLYTTEGTLMETFEQVSTIELALEDATIVVVSGHRIGSVENVLSLGLFYPLPAIEVENDCENITFSTTQFYNLNINGETIASNNVSFLIEDLNEINPLQSLDFDVKLVVLEENNNLNCSEISSLQYSYLRPAAVLPTDTMLCDGASLGLSTPFHDTFEYEWNTGGEEATTIVHNIHQDSTISVLVTNGIGCEEEATILVEIADIVVELPNDTLVNAGSLVTLCVAPEVGSTYQWSNGNSDFCNPMQVDASTQIWVNVQNEAGCTASDTMMITITIPIPNPNPEPPVIVIEIPQKEKELENTIEEPEAVSTPKPKTSCNEGIYIPNVLDLSSPAKENRVFQVFSNQEFEQVAIAKIFDRQGGLLVQKQGFSQDLVIWEGEYRGRPVNNGVFAYWMIIETEHDQWITCKGDITVVGGRSQ